MSITKQLVDFVKIVNKSKNKKFNGVLKWKIKKIVVCSKNKAKNDAVKKVLHEFFKNFEIRSLETKSGVSETPIGDDEGIKGCLNRIENAIGQEANGELYIAMEGILSNTKYGTFLCGWTVIFNKLDNEYYFGCSAKIKIPDEIANNLNKEQRLSDLVAKYAGKSGDEISVLGTNGLLSNGAYTRTDEFVDSLLCAISTKFKKIK